MFLIDNIRLKWNIANCLSLICVQLFHSHTFSSSVLYSFTLLNPFIHTPFPLLYTLNFPHLYTATINSYLSSSFRTSRIPPFVPLSSPSWHTSLLLFLIVNWTLALNIYKWHSGIFQWTFFSERCAWGVFQTVRNIKCSLSYLNKLNVMCNIK